jgi:N utilization substance protein B
MLNRRHLRIKVLQALYGWFQGDNEDFAKSEKNLFNSIDKIYDLYLYYLLIFEELLFLANHKIEEAKNKKLPTRADLEPNLRFVNNKVFKALSINKNLKAEAQKRKISWAKDKELVRKIFHEIRESELYEAYMQETENQLESDIKFTSEIFTEFIANSQGLQNELEEKSISWIDDIDLVCNTVLKTIKNIKNESNENMPLAVLYKEPEEDKEFVKNLFKKTIVQSNENEAIIKEKATNWELDRIAAMDMLLMKMAITEAREFASIPTKVTLNEYIEISKFYSTPKSNIFINGILDKIISELKIKGKIIKTGRGLIEN